MEIEPNGSAIAIPLVRLQSSPRQHARATDTEHAPWHILYSDDKKRARLNCISHLLSQIPYKKLPRKKLQLPQRSKKGAYDDQASLAKRHFVPEKY